MNVFHSKLQTTHNAKFRPLPSYRLSNGFTLVEVIVVLAVISILVAVLTPTVLKYIADAQQSRASEDVKTISTMLNDLIKDTGQYPGNKLFTRNFICAPGTLPTGGSWSAASTDCRSLSNHLLINNPDEDGTIGESTDDYRPTGKVRWKGPYLTTFNEDPWGNAYEVNASTLVGANTSPTWVISAGPDGVFQTATADAALSGDDVGTRIK